MKSRHVTNDVSVRHENKNILFNVKLWMEPWNQILVKFYLIFFLGVAIWAWPDGLTRKPVKKLRGGPRHWAATRTSWPM